MQTVLREKKITRLSLHRPKRLTYRLPICRLVQICAAANKLHTTEIRSSCWETTWYF